MVPYFTSRPFVWVTAAVFVVLIAAVAMMGSGPDEDPTVFAPLGPSEAEVLGALARCRAMTPDDTAALNACRRAWAENRQRFFARTLPLPAIPPALDAPGGAMTNPDQVLTRDVEQGRVR